MEREQRQILKEVFPDLEYKVIDHALKIHQEDPHKAIDWLLMRVFAPLPPCPGPHPSATTSNTINVEQQQNVIRFREEVLRWHHALKKEIKRRSKKAEGGSRNKNLPQVPSRSQSQGTLIGQSSQTQQYQQHQPQQSQQFYPSTDLNGHFYAGRTRSQSATLPVHQSVSSSSAFQSIRNSFISLMGDELPPPSYHERHSDPMVLFIN